MWKEIGNYTNEQGHFPKGREKQNQKSFRPPTPRKKRKRVFLMWHIAVDSELVSPLWWLLVGVRDYCLLIRFRMKPNFEYWRFRGWSWIDFGEDYDAEWVGLSTLLSPVIFGVKARLQVPSAEVSLHKNCTRSTLLRLLKSSVCTD